MSDSYKPILDREYIEDAMRQLREQISLLEELVDYGTALIPRAFVSSPKDHKATHLLFVLLQQFVAHLDGASVLLSKGCAMSANMQLRALLENSMMLTWILSADTDNKIDHIHVANIRRRLHSQSIAVPNTDEANKHADTATFLKLTQDQRQEVADEVSRLGQYLTDPKYAAINANFEKVYKKRGHDPEWYKLCGVQSIRQIAAVNGKEKVYTFLYSPFSGVVHGGDRGKSIRYRRERVEVNSIRQVQEVPGLSKLAATCALEVYRTILDTYRPGELENFGRKYKRDWRLRHQKTYKFETKCEWLQI